MDMVCINLLCTASRRGVALDGSKHVWTINRRYPWCLLCLSKVQCDWATDCLCGYVVLGLTSASHHGSCQNLHSRHIAQVWSTYSPVKNNPADALAKVEAGGPSHSATTGELDIYQVNCR